MKTNDLASLGFSNKTIRRLQHSGIMCIDDFVSREESITQKLEPFHGGLDLDQLDLSYRTRRGLSARHIDTVTKLLSATNRELLGGRNFGLNSLADAAMALIKMGFDENDGFFLSKQNMLRHCTSSYFYRELLKLDQRGQLDAEFKSWFNRIIEGYTPPKSGVRTVTILPFMKN